MEKGDVVQVRNIGTPARDQRAWASGRVIRSNPDGTHVVEIDHEEHALHGKTLVVDDEHLRVPAKEC